MPEFPRLTGALRAFGVVSSKDDSGPVHDLATRKSLILEKQKAKSLSWESLTSFFKKNASDVSNGDVSEVTKQLIATAKSIVGSEESAETIQCGAAFLFDIFKSVDSVGQREATQLRNTFGPYPATAATKACQLVRKMVGWLSEAALAQLHSQREEGDGAATNEEFGRSIKFSMDYLREGELEEEVSSEDDEFASEGGTKDFDLLQLAASAHNSGGQAAKDSKEDLSYDSAWMRATIGQFFQADDAVLSMGLAELASTTYDVLSSQRSDLELQNEMFDLLGFDRFELIQQLLEKRHKIVKSWKAESKRALLAQIPKKQAENERPTYGCQVVVQSVEEKYMAKQQRKEEKRSRKDGAGRSMMEDQELAGALDMTPEELRLTREAALRAAASAPLFSCRSASYTRPESYPFVFDKQAEAHQSSAYISGSKLVLPDNIKRKDERLYEEIDIPPSGSAPANVGKERVPISSLDEIGQRAFPKTKSLNLIQSVVFDTAYKTNENLLICAPTGAGKTNIAMLTILHEIKQHISHGVIKKDEFKIVYVAPMKALAAEMVRNFGARLEALGISVRELTGDMSLTKQEILKTQMLVTTPEKWDVVTRKATGDVALAQLVRLLIIDEVHLLHDDRGPVIETLVARTKRQVESSQSMIRIVGLSATLPNYLDVATFLNVNPYLGLFFFDGRFRPVPLGQTFIGIKAVNKMNQMRDFNTVCYDKVLKQVQAGYQVMVFVHARNETVRTAFTLAELARNKGDAALFAPEQCASLGDAQKAISRSRNKQLREMFQDGFGIHHAGMLRQDRNLVEKYFSEGHIKVLVCTATLAWGVNLPAHAVIIKGTQIYDAKRGQFVDLGILDVMQIFGRAGRPQFDTFGHGTIITTHDKLSHYISLMTRQNPIESQFTQSLIDNLNAEISLGTVTNVDEAVKWMSYTYLYVRMRKNPLVYGIPHTFREEDPQLETHRMALVIDAARQLDKAKMIRFEEHTGYMFSTDLGRIASNFYIKHATVEVINEMMKAAMSEGDILDLVANAQEFQQIKVRDDEMDELDRLTGDGCEMLVKGGKENTHGKVNILLQSYVSRISVDSFSLISDMAYVAQNASRIMRALFEVALKQSQPLLASRLLEMCKMVEKRLWTFENPMRQFTVLSHEILDKLEARRLLPEKLREMDSKEIGLMVSHVKMGPLIKKLVHQIPLLALEASVQPVTRTVLRVRLDITPDFKWDDKVHGGTSEPFWIWVEDPDNNHIYHSEYFLLHKKQVYNEEPQSIVFTIPIFEPLPSQYYVKAVSDRWIGSTTTHPISFQHLILPERHPPHTDLLTLQPLPLTAMQDMRFEALYSHTHFNPIQTQIFHTVYHTDCNVLLGAPTGSGKTLAAELAIFRVFKEYPKFKAVYIAPLKALVRERMEDWKVRIEQKLGKKVVELTGDVTPDMRAVASADLIVTTPEKWDGVSRSWQTRSYVKAVALLVIDEIHLLGEDRGPVLEVIVSRTNFISSHTEKKVRVVGLSTALANARDLADWLGIKEMGLFNFRPSVRPVPLEVHVKGFPGQHYCPRMATMNKPCFQAIKTHSPHKPVLIFVSSRRQTRLTALDLIAFLAAEDNPKAWLHMPEEDMEQICGGVRETNLKLTLAFGIGLHHAGLTERDRKVVEELFVNQKIQVLIATSTLAWGVNFPAHLVVVKGTEYFDGKTRRYVDFPITDVLQMMGRAGRPQFDDQGVAMILVHDVKKHFYKKFLYEPFPVESNLLDVLSDHLNAEVVAGTISSKQDAMDYITWTYFFRRLVMNPSFYNLENTEHSTINKYLSGLVERALLELEASYCLEIGEDNRSITPLTLGRVASYYYLQHTTVRGFCDTLRPDSSVQDLISVLSNATEFAELPVRHNEDQINLDLADRVPLEVCRLTLDSAHTKTHILVQAHLSRLDMPSSDYATDTKSVLDQALRVLQAMLDVCADQGWLVTTLNVVQLIQMLVQARWHDESSLLTLPHLEPAYLYCFRLRAGGGARPKGCPDLPGPIETLPELVQFCAGRRDRLTALIGSHLDRGQIDQMLDVLVWLPMLEVRVEVSGWMEGENTSLSRPLNIWHRGGLRPEADWVPVHADQEYVLNVTLNQINRPQRSDGKAHAPRFPKPKDQGWILIVGDADSREVLALKRVGALRRGSTRAQLALVTPDTPGRRILTLYLLSDAYLGLDQQYDLCLEVTPPSVEAQVNSELNDLSLRD